MRGTGRYGPSGVAVPTGPGQQGATLEVDGVAIEGNQVPYAIPGATVQVTAIV